LKSKENKNFENQENQEYQTAVADCQAKQKSEKQSADAILDASLTSRAYISHQSQGLGHQAALSSAQSQALNAAACTAEGQALNAAACAAEGQALNATACIQLSRPALAALARLRYTTRSRTMRPMQAVMAST
jgi:hypothetical protein